MEETREQENERRIARARYCHANILRLIAEGAKPLPPRPVDPFWHSGENYRSPFPDPEHPFEDKFDDNVRELLYNLMMLEMSYEEVFPGERPMRELVKAFYEAERKRSDEFWAKQRKRHV